MIAEAKAITVSYTSNRLAMLATELSTGRIFFNGEIRISGKNKNLSTSKYLREQGKLSVAKKIHDVSLVNHGHRCPIVVVILLVIFCLAPAMGDNFSWSDCGGTHKKVVFDSFQLEPDPLKFSSKAFVSGQLRVLSQVKSMSAESVLQKKIVFVWSKQLKDCPNNIGTCDINDLCDELKKRPALCKAGFPCSCPIEANQYKFSASVDLPQNDYGYFGTGAFYYKVALKEDGMDIGCVEVYFDMEDKRKRMKKD